MYEKEVTVEDRTTDELPPRSNWDRIVPPKDSSFLVLG